ncbi:hypothetical protein [Bacillus sp. 2205SS5-2]|uniref:hypothetical protein n=1 Tax=Bacillus sp. 2205SS5-2 TaxID=3109031 RepID=UPI003005653E
MSTYREFIVERERIDYLIEQGYQITHVTENLSGAYVSFSNGTEEETLHLKTADARKYFSNFLRKHS